MRSMVEGASHIVVARSEARKHSFRGRPNVRFAGNDQSNELEIALTNTFDCFVGIDWSGANGERQKGLQIAMATPGSSAPVLVRSPHGPWSRKEAAHWLCDLLREQRALIGLDFAFGFPALPALEAGVSFDWDYVERLCACDDNFYGGRFFRDASAAHAALVLSPWLRGDQCGLRPLRTTEMAAKRTIGATPSSVFVAMGPAQVGLSSISGMRLLRVLRDVHADTVSIWPFEAVDGERSALVEIFPRYFACSKGLRANLADHGALNAALAAFGSEPMKRPPASEDEGDALLSAAALRCLAAERAAFVLPDAAARREGWIFGVPFGDVP